jgi:DNA-binding NarL/FixJ family response regulator
MLNPDTRIAILELSRRGLGIRAVARALGVSRGTVCTVLFTALSALPAEEGVHAES